MIKDQAEQDEVDSYEKPVAKELYAKGYDQSIRNSQKEGGVYDRTEHSDSRKGTSR